MLLVIINCLATDIHLIKCRHYLACMFFITLSTLLKTAQVLSNYEASTVSTWRTDSHTRIYLLITGCHLWETQNVHGDELLI